MKPISDSKPSINRTRELRQFFRVSLRFLLLLGIILTVFVGIETNRINDQQRVIDRLIELQGKDTFLTETRYESLASSEWLKSLLGEYWNQDVISISLESYHWRKSNPDAGHELIDLVSRLKRLQVLVVCTSDPTEEEVQKLARMKSLKWIVIYTSAESSSRSEIEDTLKRKLPNTFVTIY